MSNIVSATGIFAILLSVPGDSSARIVVKGDLVTFTQERKPKPDDCGPLKQIQQIHQPTEFAGPPAYNNEIGNFFLEPYKSDHAQGLRVTVAKTKQWAVIQSYYCTKPLAAAEIPYTCDSVVFAVDASGFPLSSPNLRGNWIGVELHHSRPYFLAKRDSCCDSATYAELFDFRGRKICSIKDHRNDKWAGKKTFNCANEEAPAKTVRLKDKL